MGLEPPPTGDKYPVGLTHNNLLRIYPLGSKGEERVWRKSYESCNELIIQNRLICSARDSIYYLVEGTSALFSNWVGKRYNAGTKGANLLRDILGVHNPFSYPKSIHTVEDAIFAIDVKDACILDYFAGSGTTAHAIINLNRNDGGHRKYVLVEMANYFDTVILPRLKKIIYSSTYKEGKPVSRNGITQLFKYVRLESYEDTLDALELTPQNDLQKGLLAQNPELTEDYRLRYALGSETSESATLLGKQFSDPFAYVMPTVRDGVREDTGVDLAETFNYLLGLCVTSRRRIDEVLAITGTDAEDSRYLVLWRNTNEIDNAALDTWFVHHRDEIAR